MSKNPLERRLKPVSKIQKDFLRIGVGAETWLRLAAFEGVQRINFKIEKAVNLAKMYGDETINQVLTIAAEFHRFNVEDFVTILETLNPETDTENSERFYVLNSDASLAQGTTGWAGFGINNKSVRPVMAEEVA